MEAWSNLTQDHSHTLSADILAPNWSLDKPAAFNLSVMSPLNSSVLFGAGLAILPGEQACNGIWPHHAPIPSTGPVTSRPNVVMSTVAPIPCPSEGHSGSAPSPIIVLQQQSSPQVLSAPPSPASFPSAAFSANNLLQAQIPSQQLEIVSSCQHPGPHKKSCPVEGC